MENMITIGCSIAIISIVLYIITNFERISNFFKKYSNEKILHYGKLVFYVLIAMFFINFISKKILDIYTIFHK